MNSESPAVLPWPEKEACGVSAPGASAISALFAATLFLSATLLFLVQPLVAKMIVPFLGGTPSVWNTCMLFFQGMLLAGYAYAHLVSRRLSPGRQMAVHIALVLVIVAVLPIRITPESIGPLSPQAEPTLWLLARLGLSAALPFFVVSTTAPLLQSWFARTSHPSAHDPYFLYAASNCGSLLALIAYPALVEPLLRLRDQSLGWAYGYGLLALLIASCAGAAMAELRRHRASETVRDSSREENPAEEQEVGTKERLRWIGLAFVPSSLMLGATTYLSTDIASIPLLWVLPLALYLLTFVLAFARKRLIPLAWMQRALPAGAVALLYLLLSEATHPAWLLIALHLVFLFIAAMAAHGELAQARPPTRFLTQYYLLISLGGFLGGLVNAIVAPSLFTRVIEYPLTVILACVIARSTANRGPGRILNPSDWLLPLFIAGLTAALILLVPQGSAEPQPIKLVIIFGIPLVICYCLVDRPVRFGLGLTALFLAAFLHPGGHGKALAAERNFFGVVRVTRDSEGRFRQLIHGNTIHGRQFIDPARQSEPLSYYHRTGPLGQIFKSLNARSNATEIAVVGLGAGSVLAYAEPDQNWTLYEINPAVVRIAQDPRFFSYLSSTRAGRTEMKLGDARLRLEEARPGQFDLIILDAFSSDSIPVHLMTKEAFDLYVSKLAPDGLLAFHISNRCLDLEPVVGNLARHSKLFCLSYDEMEPGPDEAAQGKTQSHWVVLARRLEHFGTLRKDSRWLPLAGRPDQRVWTDDFSNILGVFKWR